MTDVNRQWKWVGLYKYDCGPYRIQREIDGKWEIRWRSTDSLMACDLRNASAAKAHLKRCWREWEKEASL